MMERGGEEEEEEEEEEEVGGGWVYGGMKVNRKNKHKHIKCMQLPGTWLYATSDNNNHKARKDALEERIQMFFQD